MRKRYLLAITVAALVLFLAMGSASILSAESSPGKKCDKHGKYRGDHAEMGGGHMMKHAMMMGDDVSIEVADLSDGVTMTIRSKDKDTARKLQIMGEMMKLKHELKSLGGFEHGGYK